MMAITTHPAMAGRLADRPLASHPQQDSSGTRSEATRFADMLHTGIPPGLPSVEQPDKDSEAIEPALDIAGPGNRDEGRGESPRPDGREPEGATAPALPTVRETPGDIATPSDRASESPSIAASDEEVSQSPGNSPHLASLPFPGLPGHAGPVDPPGRKQRSSTPAGTAGTRSFPERQQSTASAPSMSRGPEIAPDLHASRPKALAEHDINPPKQSAAPIARPVRIAAAPGYDAPLQAAADEPVPAAETELAIAGKANHRTGAVEARPPEWPVTAPQRPRFGSALVPAAQTILPVAASNGRDGIGQPDPSGEFSGLSGIEATTRELRTAAPITARHGPDLSQQIARQLAEFAPRPQQTTEVRLNPEELGRVRMTMLQSDGAISVTITAERGDTLDLMRRHIGLLAEEFRQIGYGTITFDFGADERGQRRGPPVPGQDPTGDHAGKRPEAATDDQQASPLSLVSVRAANGSIDIRL